MIDYVVNFFATPVPDYGLIIKEQSQKGVTSNYGIIKRRKL